MPLGSTRAVPVDVSIICATHRDLREMMQAKTFRQDLYYRLNGLAVKLPPLRERSDLATLVRRILDHGVEGRHLALSPEAHALLQGCSWPGNIRQLFNVLRTAAVMAGTERWIRAEHLPEDFLDEVRSQLAAGAGPVADPSSGAVSAAAAPTPSMGTAPAEAPSVSQPEPVGEPAVAPARQSLQDVERETIRRAVDEARGNISVAAKRLGVSRNTIYRRLRWNERSSD